MEINLLKRDYNCKGCNNPCKLSKYYKNIDKNAWRCMEKSCEEYKFYFSISKNSIFEDLRLSLKDIMKVILRYSCRQQVYTIYNNLDMSEKTIRNILNKLVVKIPIPDFSNDKLGGPGFIIQVDETMLNYKVKSRRGRAATNKTDALCIVETRNKITRVYAQVIKDKKAETIIPIICNQIVPGSVIWTDEHRSYLSLVNKGF
ncbi:hypothetical protein DMUE_2030 [Dictyocoela muelleri]|nr:hypothetical protein DMUE_2030 [Dictyocoela muelleri]